MVWLDKIRGLLQGIRDDERLRRGAITAGIALMILLLISTLNFGGSDASGTSENPSFADERKLEQRLVQLISEIDGVSSPKVMLTLDSSEQLIYASDESRSTASDSVGSSEKSESSIVLSGSTRQPLQTEIIMPKVRGVAVICGGAENAEVRERVVNTVAGVLDISTSRIYVTY